MKLITFINLLLFVICSGLGWKNHEIFNSKKGEVALSFNLSLGQMSANTDHIYSILDLNAHAVIFNVDIESFHFNNPLVEQQFKTVYMEVDKFPKTTYVGKLAKEIDLDNREEQHIEVNGVLEMHGVSTQRKINASVQVSDDEIEVKSKFMVNASSHGIDIPAELFTDGKDEISVILNAAYKR